MRVFIRSQAKFQSGTLVVALAFMCGRAHGQQVAEHFRAPSGIGATVSVATLRIPQKAWKHFAKAKVAAERNLLAESDRETAKAIAIAPDFAAAYLLRASSEVKAHSFDAAIADVKEVRRIEPDLMWAGVVLAGAYNGLGRYEDSHHLLLGLHGSEAESWQVAHESARAAIGLNDVEGALHWSEIALNSAPDNFPDARLVRANAFILAHRWSEAQAQMELFLQSKMPQERRAEVLTVFNSVKRRARLQELEQVASR